MEGVLFPDFTWLIDAYANWLIFMVY
jgi:hypothetical protein